MTGIIDFGLPILEESEGPAPLFPLPAGTDFIDYIFQFDNQGSFLRDTSISELIAHGFNPVALLIYNPVEALQSPRPAIGNILVFPPQLAQSSVALSGFWGMITIQSGIIPQLETHPNIQIINDRTLMFKGLPSVILNEIDVTHINIIINSFGVYVRDGLLGSAPPAPGDGTTPIIDFGLPILEESR